MITTTAATIDATGISAPSYEDILEYLRAQYQGIYGADVYLGNDSKDGQFLGIIAKTISDVNSVTISVYNAFSPATAQGANLSSVVKINGIRREASSNSTVDVQVGGQAGMPIINGVIIDPANNRWSLPAEVDVPPAGTVTVTATCQTPGAIQLAPNTTWTIGTPTRGWQSVSNVNAASPGAPVEEDPTLRQRQATSTAIPSLTVLEGIVGAVANIPGVTRYAAYENDTSQTDANGIPQHTIAIVVEGGDAVAIAQAIAKKKTPGGGTFGDTPIVVINKYGMPITINIIRPSEQAITAAVSMKALAGYTSATGKALQKAVSDYINAVAIGGGAARVVEWDACIAAAKSVPGSNTFKIASLTLSGNGGAGSPDVPLAFNQAATCTPDSVVLTVN